MNILYLETVLIKKKKTDPASQYRMQVSNTFTVNFFFCPSNANAGRFKNTLQAVAVAVARRLRLRRRRRSRSRSSRTSGSSSGSNKATLSNFFRVVWKQPKKVDLKFIPRTTSHLEIDMRLSRSFYFSCYITQPFVTDCTRKHSSFSFVIILHFSTS